MTLPRAFVRLLFLFLSLVFMTAFAVSTQNRPTISTYLWGAGLGLFVGMLLIFIDSLFKKFSLRSFNLTVLGLFFGYLMASALVLIFKSILDITGSNPGHFVVEIVKIFIFLFGTYLGVMMTLRASDEIYVSLPFIKFTPTIGQIKELLIDLSALSDARILDLAATGLLDKRLLLPRFLLQELHRLEEGGDEMVSAKAKRGFEVIRKLEMLPDLHLRYQDTDFPEIKESANKILRLARLLDSDVLISDMNRIQTPQVEGIKIINLHTLSRALKPLMQKGELLKIKIQRLGKEELQGVGYLEDGTMVVVNGAGGFIGKTVSAYVLSVNHTTTGRMVFCNIAEQQANSDAIEL